MSEIIKDVGEIWARLFDHRAYLNGEINYTHREFELKRADKEVEYLFSLLEKVTDIKDTQLNRLQQCAQTNVFTVNTNLYMALNTCNSIEITQQKYKENSSLAVAREDRKLQWEKFMDDMTYKCERVDNTFDEKEEELNEFYVDLEPIIESMVLVKPSETLCSSIKKLNPALNMPSRIKYLFLNSTIKDDDGPNHHKLISLSTDDYEELHRLEKHHKTKDNSTEFTTQDIETFSWDNEKGYLCVEDLVWLHRHLNDQNVHLHELLSSSTVCVPENQKIERNPELEKRCIRLKIQQENRVYKSMTKNVDNMRIHYPEDTIAYQIKQFNKQLIAVFQFIVSVLTGFAFGFIGIELMVGTLDFGFKLLLGIMCSLIIALAELYFLAKQLNEI